MLRRTPRGPRKRMRSGHMLENGLSRNPLYSRVWRVIRVWLLKTQLPIMPFLPNSQRKSTTKAKLWLCNMKLSFKVSQISKTGSARSSLLILAQMVSSVVELI